MIKTPTHLGIAFNSCPIYWSISDWNEFICFFELNRIAYLTFYTRDGWDQQSKVFELLPVNIFINGKQIKQCPNQTIFLSFIDYNDSKPQLASLTRQLCESKDFMTPEALIKSLDNSFPRLDFLLVQDDYDLGGFPPLMLAFTEIFKLSPIDDSVSGFIEGIKFGIKRYSQTIQRNGI